MSLATKKTISPVEQPGYTDQMSRLEEAESSQAASKRQRPTELPSRASDLEKKVSNLLSYL